MEFDFKFYGETHKGRVVYSKYTYGNNLYIGIEYLDTKYNVFMPWCDLSTNLNGFDNLEDKVFVECGSNNGYEKPLTETLIELGLLKEKVINSMPYNMASFDMYSVDLSKLHEIGIELK